MSTTKNSAYNSHLCFTSPSIRGKLMVLSTATILSPNPTKTRLMSYLFKRTLINGAL